MNIVRSRDSPGYILGLFIFFRKGVSSMRTLEFKVNGQQLKRKETCNFSKIVMGSVGYLQTKFYFNSTGWGGCTKAASFWVDGKEYAVLLDDNNMCAVPKEASTSRIFYISVTGVKPGTDYSIVTGKIKVKQEA